MKTIRIKVYPKNKTQLKSIADFLSNGGIEFELAEKEEFVEFFSELRSSLGQIMKIKDGEMKKERAKDFLNGL